MKTFANVIKTRAEFDAWANTNNLNEHESRAARLVLIIDNTFNIWRSFEWLGNCCRKAFKKYGGLDLGYLSNCSVLKTITREARKYDKTNGGGGFTMAEDRAARIALAGRLWFECFCE